MVWGGGYQFNWETNDLTSLQQLQNLTSLNQVLKSQFHILRIGLLGSYVNGTNSADSDLDLIFELEEGKLINISILMLHKVLNKKM